MSINQRSCGALLGLWATIAAAFVILVLLDSTPGSASSQTTQLPDSNTRVFRAAPMSFKECEVWDRERSFARSVEGHDSKGFMDHLSANAVFIGGGKALRGATAVLKAWSPLIAGGDVVLRWHPGSVEIAADVNVALSHGKYWMEDRRSEASQRFRVGTFVSTWIKEFDGKWRVLYDGGGDEHLEAASAEDIERLINSFPKECSANGQAH